MILLFNVGLPMIIPALYLMVPGLVPIVVIESLVISKRLGWKFRPTVIKVSVANLVSTLLGIPVTWFLLALFGSTAALVLPEMPANRIVQGLFFIVLGSAWIPPVPPDMEWIVFPAMGFILVPFFFASWAVEYLAVKAQLARAVEEDSQVDGRKLRRGLRDANLLSYLLLELAVLGIYLYTRAS